MNDCVQYREAWYFLSARNYWFSKWAPSNSAQRNWRQTWYHVSRCCNTQELQNNRPKVKHKQKVTNINHAKFDIHTLDNLEVTRTFMFNLHIQTILAKIMWDKLAECTASTIDQFFTWKQTFFGPNPTFLPVPPCNVVRKERLADESSNIASGGKGGASEYCSNSAIRHFVPHILARIVATYWMRNLHHLHASTFLYLEINARECKSSFVAKKTLLCLWVDQVTVTQLSRAPIRRLNCIVCATFFWSL